MIDAGPRERRAVRASAISCPPSLGAGRRARRACPTDRFIDGIDQTSFLLAPDGRPTASITTTGWCQTFSGAAGRRVQVHALVDQRRRHRRAGPGGFTGVAAAAITYARLYNLYLDPKETAQLPHRKLAYLEAFLNGVRDHLMTFRDYPPKLLVGLNV